MQNIIAYDINEIFALVIAVIMGTGAYIGFMVLKKQKQVNVGFIVTVIFINLFVTYIASGLLKKLNFGEYRTIVLPIIAYLGQYLVEWLDKRFLRIFDAGMKKVGLELNMDNPEEKIEEDEKQN